ncbi:MAG: DNA polymerase I [Acetivibrionales bacterium]|jgi:DNA polymerase-1
MNPAKLMLIDGNSIINRAFYGLQGSQLLSTSDGLYTNAVYGFLNILSKYLEEEEPEYLCVAFDVKAPTFRHKEYKEYKAQRKGMPDELAVQIPVLKEVLDAMNIKRLEYEGYEADDIIGSVSLCAEKEGMDVIIVTGDRDSLQLASRKTRIKIPVTRGGRTETKEYDYDRIVETYGITPYQFIDVKGLMGDPSDNIPGVRGIGEKTALALIREYKSIEGIYENINQLSKRSIREKLEANRDMAFMSKRLAAIEREMPHLCNIHQLKRGEFDKERLYSLFIRLEFNSYIEKFNLKSIIDENSTSKKEVSYVKSINSLKELKQLLMEKGEFCLFYLLDAIDSITWKLTGVAIAWDMDKSAYVLINSDLTEEDFLSEMCDILEDGSIRKFGHDMKNFILYLKTKGIEFDGLVFDTMIAAYIINPTRTAYTVSGLCAEHLHKQIQAIEQLQGKGKSFRRYSEIPVEEIAPVSVAHAETIYRLRSSLDSDIRSNGQLELYYDIELPLVEVLADMEYRGFKVNIDGLKTFSSELEEKIALITSQIFDIAGEQFNINSPKQLGVILFEKLQLPALKKTKTGYSTNAEVLEQLEPQHEIVSKILEYRQLVKLKSTYVEGLLNMINPKTGRIHTSFNQTVTATGRISSTEPNLQNIPVKLEMGRKIRKVFISEDNYLLSDADYSQIELRVLAHITEDENMISAFRNGEDIHTNTASRVFGVPREDVTSLMRARAKAVNFGIVYGIGDFSLSKDLGVTRREAKKYINEYLDKYPGVRKYMHDIVEYGKDYGYVTTLFNRRRYLPELKSSNFNLRSFGERIAMNTPIQGSAADIIKIAMVKVYNELLKRKMKSKLILQVHDELIVETFIEEKEQVAAILKECMENAVKLHVPLNIDIRAGSTWYETK